ncbi:MAG: formate dehydrogenase iron-sulfur subunit [Verrucomicrobiales bacterium]|jgi:formate dehydrogenase iron-sulfur subunit
MSGSTENLQPLLATMLRDQSKLMTAVTEFADWHSEADSPHAEHYKKLIPLSKPGEGEQYAFEVNLDQCTGCKACVVACHSLNGLDEDESWRDVGTLLGSGPDPLMQTVTTACHHCEDPACANGCPVLAYDKSPETGIVRHLDDQCIGCSYCVMKCPYDVPKFSESRGIVRKCDMCQDRLAVGEAPACVQACPNEAIAIRIVKTGETPDVDEVLVPGAFRSNYTLPTTRYLSQQAIGGNAVPADAGQPRLDHSHGPLAWMLVFTQMGAGTFAFGAGAAIPPQAKVALSIAAAAITLVGMTLSLLHLGQPLKAWRAFLGWRKSWLSREIITFGLFAKLAILPPFVWWVTASSGWLSVTMALAACAGAAAVFCSIMVYADTQRPFWTLPRVAMQFIGTTIALGAGLTSLTLPLFSTFSILAIAVLASWDIFGQWLALRNSGSPIHRSARVMRELLPRQTLVRRTLLFTGACLFLTGAIGSSKFAIALALCSTVTALLIDRYQFFTACSGPRMTSH